MMMMYMKGGVHLPLVLLLLGEPLLLDAVRLPGLEPEVSPELLLCVCVPSTACNA